MASGDSGGPLQAMNQNGDFVLMGIVSFGFRCAAPGLLGMYTDVSQYIDWIKEKSGKDAPILVNSFQPTLPDNGAVNNGTAVLPANGGGHHSHHHWLHIIRPYRRPIKVFLYKNNHLHPTIKMLLHKPIVRQHKKP